MHVGHLRSTVIGDAIVRTLEFLGHTVIRENHIGDWGRPFGMLIEHLLDIGEEAAVAENQKDLDAFYKAANAKFSDDEEFADRARQRVVSLQSYDPQTIALWDRLVSMSTEYFNRVLPAARRAAHRWRPRWRIAVPGAHARGVRPARGRRARGRERRRAGRVPTRVHQPRERAVAA